MMYFLFFLLGITTLPAQQVIPLWPEGRMPNSKGLNLTDSIAEERLYQVGSPRLYCFFAPKEKNTGAAILIVPGGGYRKVMADYTKPSTALYYQERGINTFVVCYRLPTSPDLLVPEIAPLQDIQRAMRIIHAHAEEWDIDPKRVGVNGTSAGGHGASTLGTHPEDVSAIGDELDRFSYIPAFMMLISPVISFRDAIAHQGSKNCLLGKNPSDSLVQAYSNENCVTQDTSPTLLIHADNDTGVSPLNSIVFYQALKAAGISSSLHIFPFGSHRLGIENNPGSAKLWPELSVEWLKEMKFIPK